MKLALITGARGFIGRHLSLSLHKLGIQVCGIGHGAWTESAREAWGVDYWLNGDVTKRNLDIVQSSAGNPDMVFHLAGGSSVGLSLLTPEEDFRRTVLSTAELLEWAHSAAPDARLVLASSAAVYGSGYSLAILESAQLSPYSPYGYHKRMAEELFESYGKNFDLNVAIVRLFSVYGPGLCKQLLWDLCTKLHSLSSDKIVLGGSGEEQRDWLYVDDAAAYLTQIANYATTKCFILNGGTGRAISVREIAEMVCAAWKSTAKLSFSGQPRPGDPQSLVADMSLCNSKGLIPNTSVRDGINRYVAWFRSRGATHS